MRSERTVLAADLIVGDVLLATAIGGHEGEILSLRIREPHVFVDFAEGRGACLGSFEVCSVLREERPRLAKVHNIFDPWLQLARNAGR